MSQISEFKELSMKLIKMITVVLMLSVGLVSCMQPAKSLTDGEIVEKQTVAWLQAMVDGKWDETYQFTSPGYRSGVSVTAHAIKMASRRVTWLGGEVLGHSCEDDICVVDMRIVFKVHQPVRSMSEYEGSQVIKENWLKLDDQWWLVPGK